MPLYFFFELFLFCAQGFAGFFDIPVVALEVVNDEMLFPNQLCFLKGAGLINILDFYFCDFGIVGDVCSAYTFLNPNI